MNKFLAIIISIVIPFMAVFADTSKNPEIPLSTVEKVTAGLTTQNPSGKTLIEKGVKQTAKLWQKQDGTEEEFIRFCLDNYISDPAEKKAIFLKISDYMEAIWGNYNEMTLQLQKNIHEATGPLLKIDEQFAAYSPNTHFSDDMYANKLAFYITLNFPEFSLEEKELLGTDRLSWAYARLGDLFTSRVPAELQQAVTKANSDADVYISNYNIYAGHLLDKSGKKIFPENMILLSHWNLRDEIKASYNKGETGLNKQKTIYEAMKRIISQEIPREVINSGDYDWNPYTNQAYQSGKTVTGNAENTTRYEIFLNNFKALKAIDPYTGNSFIDRNFSEDMEVSANDAEKLFREYLSAPEMKTAGKIVASRLNRKLQAFDIWYDGFKLRSSLNEDSLSNLTRTLYPDAKAMEKDLPDILQKLGFAKDRAQYLAEKIDVDAARGSGHAWGAAWKKQHAHLRTRIPDEGMDYKGYNIAIHEFGHNVEQTLSLYDVDYYMLNGVPNTAFTEALAFVFQKRDLDILGIKNDTPGKNNLDVLDKAWTLYEIAGVSLLDISVWKWMYANPDATATQLKEAVIRLSKEIWNEYYAPVFGIKDEPVLAIYSHMLSYPLYLSAYSYGQIIEFQLENYLQGKNFAREVDHIYRLGKLTPNQWILQATGKPLSVEPLLDAVRKSATRRVEEKENRQSWVTTWSTSQQLVEPGNLPPAPGLTGNTLRQAVRVSIGGDLLKLRFSNVFSKQPVRLESVAIAVSSGGSLIDVSTQKTLTFGGKSSVTIPAEGEVYSDSIAFNLAPDARLAITVHFGETSPTVTGHPGSRTTSYILEGDKTLSADFSGAVETDHWYVIQSIDVKTTSEAASIVALGNSITDGRGSGTNRQNRWTDILSKRLLDNPQTKNYSVLNAGLGGNCVLRGGLGPTALVRFDRDVLSPGGVRWLIILEGINDIGGIRDRESSQRVAQELIDAYTFMIEKAHTHDIKVYGCTILPFAKSFYDTPFRQEARDTVNEWIRNSGKFDAVIDFDKAMRSPGDPQALLPDVHTGDFLHPNEAGYEKMGRSISLELFK